VARLLESSSAPQIESARCTAQADYSATSGYRSRWAGGYGIKVSYRRLDTISKHGFGFTSAPIARGVEITVHPQIHLWVSSSADDGDFFAFLELVQENGSSQYVSEGQLRASHRHVEEAPFDSLGLPYHPHRQKDRLPLGSEPVELWFDLQPISIVLPPQSRLRLTVTCGDLDNAAALKQSPPPTVSIYADDKHRSRLELPLCEQQLELSPAGAPVRP